MTKEKTETSVEYEKLRKPLRKKSDQKNKKAVKINVKLPDMKKNHQQESKQSLLKHHFSLCWIIKAKNFTPQNHLLFCFTACFSKTKIIRLI